MTARCYSWEEVSHDPYLIVHQKRTHPFGHLSLTLFYPSSVRYLLGQMPLAIAPVTLLLSEKIILVANLRPTCGAIKRGPYNCVFVYAKQKQKHKKKKYREER